MTLPVVKAPQSAPAFLVEPVQVDEADVYASVQPSSGQYRRRRIYTVQERRVAVAWFLTAAQMQDVDAWFEDTLQAGSLAFSVRLPDLAPGFVWWEARWAEPYEANPIKTSSGIVWRLSGTLALSGAASATPPNTSALAIAFAMRLSATASVAADPRLSVHFGMSLLAGSDFEINFIARLDYVSAFELLIGDGFYLLIGDGQRMRIG